MSMHPTQSPTCRLLPFLAATGCLLAGCSENTRELQQVSNDPEIRLLDIAGTKIPSKLNQYHLLTSEPTRGRFPGALAVARLLVSKLGTGNTPSPVVLKPLSDQDGAYWNHLMDNVLWVREYFEIKPVNVSTEIVKAEDLLASAKRLHASLCLLYGQCDPSPERSRLVGVIYDPRSGKALATISAESDKADDWLMERPPGRPEEDFRHQNNHYLAARKFERLVHSCILDLVSLDQPKREDKPKGWQERAPLAPVSSLETGSIPATSE